MSNEPAPSGDDVRTLRRYGRIGFRLGFVVLGIGVFTASVASDTLDVHKGWAWVLAGGTLLGAGAYLLRTGR